MEIRLRGHHLLCLAGYRGMGYSPDFTRNMTALYERLRNSPSSLVTLVEGPDDLCRCYPEDKPNHCREGRVYDRDQAVLTRLGFTPGARIAWQEVMQRMQLSVTPEDIPQLCTSCPWRSYGVCEEGVARIASGQGLAPLPDNIKT
ncbi:DUF1284 domain-containing protein [Paenibacillus physcomitrellae]|uniref:DUF1284 domain-containing protein n=1 Tax=Paenibacillus physcomitrellae TaxID=1619311 RepID=A0ABQ1GNU9_9BACL|nr:DUF1284 domain-containing protein [Paenibacillus physcomitrellae]GGA47201.1 hypothetical protein GCM10010917_35580 [Paenibacillus physcomitrellae]